MFSVIDHIHEIGREEDEPRERVRPGIIEVVLFPVHPENRSAEARREGTVLREIVDAAFSRRKRSRVVIPREDDDVRKVPVELGAPSRLRRVVRVPGEPTGAQRANGQGEGLGRRVQDAQGLSKADPSPEVARGGELESVRVGSRRGHWSPSAHGDEYHHEDDAPCSVCTPQRRPPPALQACPDCISAFRATVSTTAHTAARRDRTESPPASPWARGRWVREPRPTGSAATLL